MPRPPDKRPGKPGGKRATNRLERINTLKQAALAHFLERGLEAVTIDEITRGAGVAKGTFYRYFDDKEDLVSSMMEPVISGFELAFQRFRGALEIAPETDALFEVYATLGAELASLAWTRPELIRLYLQERRGADAAPRRAIHRLARMLDASVEDFSAVAVERGLLRPSSPRVTAQVVIGAVEQLLFSMLHGSHLGEPHVVVQELISLVLEGLIER